MRPLLLGLLLLSCAKSSAPPAQITYGKPGTLAAFDLDSDTSQPGRFYDFPYPSDLRLTPDGRPQLSAFPNPDGAPMISTFIAMAMERHGFPVVPAAYFKFDSPLPSDVTSLLLDLDTPQLLPSVSSQPAPDQYVPANLLTVAPRQGIVLQPSHRYAFVVLRGSELGQPAELDELLQGVYPAGPVADLYAPLPAALKAVAVDPSEVAAATVFTTGDIVAETYSLTEALKKRYSVTIDNLQLDPTPNPAACVLKGSVTFPQFQKGRPPFNTDGLFVFGDDGLPIQQRTEISPVVIVIPKGQMPANGWPLSIYFHGSGGLSNDVIDMGPTLVKGGNPTPGLGPGYIHALHGLGSAGSALPVNPERLPGAGETAYLNLVNLPAMRDTFRQGIIEQRLYLEALKTLQIPANDCMSAAYFDASKLVAQGQSMGGMYTNLISAVEPRILAAVPTGAGGYWTYFILVTQLYQGLPPVVAALLNAATPLTFMHPALQLVETAWEPADPFVSMPRLAKQPLPGHPVRPIYEPVGKGDEYFPTILYDAVALSYGHNEAGAVQWQTMQDALRLESLDGLLPYPVTNNRRSIDGTPYTGVVVQYLGDDIEDPHSIYRQLDAVKYQYACFLESYLATGQAIVPAPADLATPCPHL